MREYLNDQEFCFELTEQEKQALIQAINAHNPGPVADIDNLHYFSVMLVAFCVGKAIGLNMNPIYEKIRQKMFGEIDAECDCCGAIVPYDTEKCPKCGFEP